jgi:hypothetical protein
MEYEELVTKAKLCNEQQVKVTLLALLDFHSPKPVTVMCTSKCPADCNTTHISETKGCQCGAWYPCKTMQLVERTLDWL